MSWLDTYKTYHVYIYINSIPTTIIKHDSFLPKQCNTKSSSAATESSSSNTSIETEKLKTKRVEKERIMIGGNEAVQSLASTLSSVATSTMIGTKARAQVNAIDRSMEGSKADG
eukprot:14248622-Ditylum_brightwellii.AAC.1